MYRAHQIVQQTVRTITYTAITVAVIFLPMSIGAAITGPF